jgi:hypothetical protein
MDCCLGCINDYQVYSNLAFNNELLAAQQNTY